jgi:peptidoglycan/LPS O-acetylase OafA/YrhL
VLTRGGVRSAPLDGIRALAVVGVLAFHAHYPAAIGGYLGVDVFFVLSGYLITRVLLRAPGRGARPGAYRDFLVRRAVRLMPALLVAMSAVLVVVQLLGSAQERALALRCTGAAGAYLMNVPAAESLQCGAMWHITWSLAAEQQFYLVWPWVLAALLAAGSRWTSSVWLPTTLCLSLYGLSLGWQLVLRSAEGVDSARVLFMPDGRSLVLLLGCALALALHGPGSPLRTLRSGALRDALCLLAAVVLVGLFGWAEAGTSHPALLALVGAGLATALLIYCLHDAPEPSRSVRMFGAPWVAYVGRISYGLYLWHEVAYRLAETVAPRGSLPAEVLRFTLSLLFAAASFALVEEPAQQWWQRRERRRQPVPVARVRQPERIAA